MHAQGVEHGSAWTGANARRAPLHTAFPALSKPCCNSTPPPPPHPPPPPPPADHFPTTEVFGCGPLLSTADGRGSDTQWTLLRFPALEVRSMHVARASPAAAFCLCDKRARTDATRLVALCHVAPAACACLHPTTPCIAPCRALQEGCHLVEAQRGIFVSTPAAFLVIEDEAAAAELRQLEAVDSTLPSSDTTELLTRLGAVLRFGRGLRDACPADVARVDAALLARVAAAAQVRPGRCLGIGEVVLLLPCAMTVDVVHMGHIVCDW